MSIHLNRKALRLHLIQNDLTQQDFAQKHGLNVGRLSSMATGRATVPSSWIAALLAGTGLTFEALFTYGDQA